ncbi:MAG: HAD family acid phosphatase [Verrucomicrobiota bacterium]
MSEPSKLREMTSHNNLHSLLFQTTSAEYIALCVQIYQLARHALLERLEEGTYRNPAIVLDLDETVIDNSAYQKSLLVAGKNFDEKTSWREWCNAAQAGAVPGALEFVRFATERKITPIFITSRENVTRKGTAQNLHKLGLLDDEELAFELRHDAGTVSHEEHAQKTRLFMKDMTKVALPFPNGMKDFELKNKFDQRVFCELVRHYEIALSLGDSLGDYAEYYGRLFNKDGERIDGHPSVKGRCAAVWQDIRLFGREFILLPNATYGSWLRALEGNNVGASDELAKTNNPVRQPLREPLETFHYDGKESPAKSVGTKLDAAPGNWTS